MHRQQSIESLRSLKLGACHFMFNILMAIVGLACVIAGLIVQENEWLWTGAAITAIWLLSIALFFIMSYSWTCPLCMGRLWVRTGCRRHRKAHQALGVSYRLGIATAVVFRRAYRCPYCGEPFSTTKTRK